MCCDFCDLVYHQTCVPAMQPHQPTRGFVCVECYRDVLPDLADTYRRIFFQLPLDAATVSPSSIALDAPVGPSSLSPDPSLASPGSDMVASEPSSLSLTTGALSTPIARLPPLPPIEPLVSPRVSTRHRVCFASLRSPAPGASADVPVPVISGVNPGTWTDARARVALRLGVDSRDAAGDSGLYGYYHSFWYVFSARGVLASDFDSFLACRAIFLGSRGLGGRSAAPRP